MFLRDRHAWMWGLFIPTFIMGIFGLMNFERMGTAKLGIADRANNEISIQLVESLKKVEALEIEESDFETLNAKIQKGDLDLLLVIPPEINLAAITQNIHPIPIDLLYNQGHSQQVGTGVLLINQVLTQFGMQIKQVPPVFALNQKSVDSRNLSYMDFIVPGIVGMMIMQLGIIGVAVIIVRFRDKGILRRLRVTPLNPAVFLFSMVATRLLLLLAQAGLIILMGVLLFDLHIYGNLFYTFIVALLGSLVFLSLGFAVSGIASTINTAMSMAQLIQMPMMFLSGTFFPRDMFPSWLQRLTDYLPLTYLAHALRQIMIENASLVDIKSDLIPLTLWAIGGFILAALVFRWE